MFDALKNFKAVVSITPEELLMIKRLRESSGEKDFALTMFAQLHPELNSMLTDAQEFETLTFNEKLASMGGTGKETIDQFCALLIKKNRTTQVSVKDTKQLVATMKSLTEKLVIEPTNKNDARKLLSICNYCFLIMKRMVNA